MNLRDMHRKALNSELTQGEALRMLCELEEAINLIEHIYIVSSNSTSKNDAIELIANITKGYKEQYELSR